MKLERFLLEVLVRGGAGGLPGFHVCSKSFPYWSHMLIIIPKCVLDIAVIVIVIINIFEK